MASDSKWNKIQNFSNWRIYVYTHTHTRTRTWVYIHSDVFAPSARRIPRFSASLIHPFVPSLRHAVLKNRKNDARFICPAIWPWFSFSNKAAGYKVSLPVFPFLLLFLLLLLLLFFLAASPPLLAEKRKERRRGKIIKPGEGREGEKRGRRGRGERNSFCGTHRYADRNGRKFVCPRAFSKERYFGNARVAKFFRDFFSFGESIPQFCEIILLHSFFLLYWRDKLVNGEIRLKEKNYSCFLIPEKGKYFVVRRKSYFWSRWFVIIVSLNELLTWFERIVQNN